MAQDDDYFHDGTDLSPRIVAHLRSVTETSGLPAGEESLQRVTENWLAKRRLYLEQCDSLEMIQEERCAGDDPRGFLLLTYSGSLVVLGPLVEGGRSFEYASLGIRADVPDLVRADRMRVTGELTRDRPAVFAGGPVERSSDLLFLAGFAAGVEPADQEERLREAAIFLTNGFVLANQSLTDPGAADLGQFNLRSIVQYVAARNGTTQALTRSIVHDFLSTVESGMLLGRRASLGALGTTELTVRAPQKARMGRHPGTGEEILIPAKPATAVPRFSFAGRVKERAARTPVDRVTGKSAD